MKKTMAKIVLLGVCSLLSLPSNADSFVKSFIPECGYTPDFVLEKTKTKAHQLSKQISSFSSNNLPVYHLLMLMDELTNTDKEVISCLSNTYYSPLEAISRKDLLSVTNKVELVEYYLRAGPDQLLNAIEQGKIQPYENFSFFAHQRMSLIGYLLLRNSGDLSLTFAKKIKDLGVDIVPLDLFYTGYGTLENHELIEWLLQNLDASEEQFMWTEPGEAYLPLSLLSKAAVYGDNKVLAMMLDQHIGDSSYALYVLLSKFNDEKKLNLEKKTNLAANIRVLLNHGAKASLVTITKSKTGLEKLNIMVLNEQAESGIDILSKEESDFLTNIIKIIEKNKDQNKNN